MADILFVLFLLKTYVDGKLLKLLNLKDENTMECILPIIKKSILLTSFMNSIYSYSSVTIKAI